MKKITFVWAGITHIGTVVIIKPFESMHIIDLIDVHVDKVLTYKEFSLLVQSVEVGNHGTVDIILIEEMTPAELFVFNLFNNHQKLI